MSLSEQQWCPTSVQVTVLQARGLRAKGKSGTNDAYAVMAVGKEKFRTSVMEKSVAPVWKEEATFDLPQLYQCGGETDRSTLHVHVLHRALVGPDKLLGQAVIKLLQISEDKTRNETKWFKLLDKTGKADKDRGEVLVDMQFMRNNMTASMFDLSAAGKSRSRLGKFKDKVRGKKKDSDDSSTVVPSFTQVLTDSEEEGTKDGEKAAKKDEKKKRHQMKLFSPKSNLQKNISQSMSILPGRNSSLSGSQSSGLNVDSSEGKKKFKFMVHKRSGSSESKNSLAEHQKRGAAEQTNLCINGSHVYREEPQPRTLCISPNISVSSSGHGSMEDVPVSSLPSVDSINLVKQYSPWTEVEEEMAEEKKEDEAEPESVRMEKRPQEERRRLEEEQEMVRTQGEEKRRIKDENSQQEEKERIRLEEEKRVRPEEDCKLAEERRRLEEEERRHIEEENIKKGQEERRRGEKIKMEEEERISREEEKTRKREEEERIRVEEKVKKEKGERIRREEEERTRREKEERRLIEEKIKQEEEELSRQEEEKERRQTEEKVKKEEGERIRREEEARTGREKEERRLIEEKIKQEKEERIRREEEEERRRREEEETRLIEEKIKKEEAEKIRREEQERRIREEEEERRLIEEKIKREEVERIRREEEERGRREEEERIRVEEQVKKEEGEKAEGERVRKEEEERTRQEKEERRLVEEKIKQEEEERMKQEEEERLVKEKIKQEEEERMKQEEEERLVKEKIKQEEEESRKQEEEERVVEEKIKKEKQKRLQEERKKREEEEMLRTREEHEEKRKLEEQQKWSEEMKHKKEGKVRRGKEKSKLQEEGMKKVEGCCEEENVRRHKEEQEGLPEVQRILKEQGRKRIEEGENMKEEEEDRIKKEEEMKPKEEERRVIEEDERREEHITQEGEENKKEEEMIRGVGVKKLKEAELSRTAEKQRMKNEMQYEVAGIKMKGVSSADNSSTNPFDKDISNNPFEEALVRPTGDHSVTAGVSPDQHRSQSVASSLGRNAAIFDEKDRMSAQRERRPAPQPPGINEGQMEDDVSSQQLAISNNPSKIKDVKTVCVPTQLSVPMVTPLSRSPTYEENAQSLMQSARLTINVAKPSKRPAPSRPLSAKEEPLTAAKTAIYSDGKVLDESKSKVKKEPTVYCLNPFEDEDDFPAHDYPKIKSKKMARAPLHPANKGSTTSSSVKQNTEGGHDGYNTSMVVTDKNLTQPCDQVKVQETPVQESQAVTVQGAEEKTTSWQKEKPPATPLRLQPVKPFKPLGQQSVSVFQREIDNKSLGFYRDCLKKPNVNDTGVTGPYSQLTQGELISLVLKQESQLSEREQKISELEKYIDNLLVRVIEEKPSILLSLNPLKKTI